MERFNRMLQAAQGMGMGGAAPGAVSTLNALPSMKRLLSQAVLGFDKVAASQQRRGL